MLVTFNDGSDGPGQYLVVEAKVGAVIAPGTLAGYLTEVTLHTGRRTVCLSDPATSRIRSALVCRLRYRLSTATWNATLRRYSNPSALLGRWRGMYPMCCPAYETLLYPRSSR